MRAPRDGDPPIGGSPPVRAPGRSTLWKRNGMNSSQNVSLSSVRFLWNHDVKRQRTQNWLHHNAFSEKRTTQIASLWMCATKIMCHSLTLQKHLYTRKSQTNPKKKIEENRRTFRIHHEQHVPASPIWNSTYIRVGLNLRVFEFEKYIKKQLTMAKTLLSLWKTYYVRGGQVILRQGLPKLKRSRAPAGFRVPPHRSPRLHIALDT